MAHVYTYAEMYVRCSSAIFYVHCLCGLQAVDKNTLLQLKGAAARGYAFDRRYGMDDTSNQIFKDCVEGLVNNVFKVRTLLVLAYPDVRNSILLWSTQDGAGQACYG